MTQIEEHSTKRLSSIPHDCQGQKPKQNPSNDGETVSDQRRLRRHDNSVQCYILDWILEQKEGITGKTGEIQMKSRAS